MDGYKTYSGILLLILGGLQSFKLIPAMSQEDTTQLADGILMIVGAAVAIYGRLHVGYRLEKAELEKQELLKKTEQVETQTEEVERG